MYMYAASTTLDLFEECLPVLVAPLVVAHPHELRFTEAVQLYRSCSTSNATTTTTTAITTVRTIPYLLS